MIRISITRLKRETCDFSAEADGDTINDKNLDYEIETSEYLGTHPLLIVSSINDKNLDYEIETKGTPLMYNR